MDTNFITRVRHLQRAVDNEEVRALLHAAETGHLTRQQVERVQVLEQATTPGPFDVPLFFLTLGIAGGSILWGLWRLGVTVYGYLRFATWRPVSIAETTGGPDALRRILLDIEWLGVREIVHVALALPDFLWLILVVPVVAVVACRLLSRWLTV